MPGELRVVLGVCVLFIFCFSFIRARWSVWRARPSIRCSDIILDHLQPYELLRGVAGMESQSVTCCIGRPLPTNPSEPRAYQ